MNFRNWNISVGFLKQRLIMKLCYHQHFFKVKAESFDVQTNAPTLV